MIIMVSFTIISFMGKYSETQAQNSEEGECTNIDIC